MQYLTSFYRHAEAVHRVALQHPGLEIGIDLRNFSLRITWGAETKVWRPRFVTTINGRMVYVEAPHPDARGFVGWTPYPIRQWPAATDKTTFKQLALKHGIATPAACVDPEQIGGPFLIKKSRSSFGEGIRGPFRRFDKDDPAMKLSEGEYYENFILGHIVKAWYWGEQWLAAEFRTPPVVVGDGQKSVRDLVLALPNSSGKAHDWTTLGNLARYCGLRDVDDVPSSGKEVLVDFKYASRYDPHTAENLNVIDRVAKPLASQFAQAGITFSRAASEIHKTGASVFALDAMVDQEGQAWLLEMNSNPMVHPDLYSAMIASGLTAEKQLDASRHPGSGVP
jgi:hypothetical protein